VSQSEAVEVDYFLVVGSGAGALTAAIRAHDLGFKTLVVEKSSVLRRHLGDVGRQYLDSQ
jgi:succinate dehydrogenase/fumarate reductase flavoprotein subunit